jgi:hypothetical protein
MNEVKSLSTFCALAFGGLCLEAGGRSKPCCKYSKWDNSLNATQVSLTELLRSPQQEELRRDLLEGIKHQGCQRCWDDEKNGIKSLRQQSNEKFNSFIDPDDLKVRVLDFGFGNTCNAACIMCESSSSSLWSEEDIELYQIGNNKFDRNPFPITNDKFDWNSQELKDLKHIIHAQNEVLAAKEFPLFLKTLDDVSNLSEKTMLISTNGSIWPTDRVLKQLSQLKNLHVQISVDAFGDKNDYIRFPLKWKQIVETTQKWVDFCEDNNFTLTARCTISILNCIYLEELLDWWQKTTNNRRLSFGYSWYPHYLSPKLFSDILMPELSKSFKRIPELKKVLGQSSQPIPKDKQLFFEYIGWMDKKRKLSFSKTFPELYSIIS